MEYRIIIETERSGKRWLFVQRRFLHYFWKYLREDNARTVGIFTFPNMPTMSRNGGWGTIDDARAHLQCNIDYDYAQSQKKIVKVEVYEGQDI